MSLAYLIHTSVLLWLWVDFIQEAFREGVNFNIFEYAAQKVLKFEKMKKEKEKKLK